MHASTYARTCVRTVYLSAEINFHDVTILKNCFISAIRSVVSSNMVYRASCWKPYTSLRNVIMSEKPVNKLLWAFNLDNILIWNGSHILLQKRWKQHRKCIYACVNVCVCVCVIVVLNVLEVHFLWQVVCYTLRVAHTYPQVLFLAV
jgi:hypothetical protein